MSNHSALTLATFFSLIGISDAFGQCAFVNIGQCAFVNYGKGETRQLEVRQIPVLKTPATVVERVLKIKRRYWPYPPADWCYVETIPTTTGDGGTTTGWIPASRVGRPAKNCSRAYR